MGYYIIRCVKSGNEFFCIWCSEEKDTLLCNEYQKILTFSVNKSANQFLFIHALTAEDVPIPTYDFDYLEKWITKGESIDNCSELLNLWNIFYDAALSTGYTFMGDQKTNELNEIYDKLFYGCNILKPDNKDAYIPCWEKEEILLAKNVLEDGMIGFLLNVENVMA